MLTLTFRSVIYLAVLPFIAQTILGEGINDINPREKINVQPVKEKAEEVAGVGNNLTVSVKITDDEEAGDGGKTEVMVKFIVTIEENIVRINGKLTDLNVLTQYELDTEIVYPQGEPRIASVIVYVLVIREELENGYQFLLEEQVKSIEKKKVKQLDVKVLTIHMDIDGKEHDRTIHTIPYEKSRIKHATLKKTCRKGENIPQEKMGDPKLPDESGWTFHPKKDGESFCSKFHKLPFAARVAILVGVIFVLLTSVLCCTLFCCRKPKTVYNINQNEDLKAEFDMEEEAEPLPEKLGFDDKQVLIA